MTEDERAQLWRQQQAQRAQAEANRLAQLAPDPAAAAAFRAAWQPVLDAQLERDA